MVHPGPWFSVGDVYRGWVRGLREAGCQVLNFNLNDRLEFYDDIHVERGGEYVKPLGTEEALRLACEGINNACYKFWPDVIVVVSGFYVPPEFFDVWRDRGHRTVMIHTESPYEETRQLTLAERVDLNILNDPTNIGRYPDGTLYIPHAYDPAIHHPPTAPITRPVDFAFVGTGYPSRQQFFESVDWSGIAPVFAGNWQDVGEGSPLRPFLMHDTTDCLANEQTADLYRRARVSANLYRAEAQDGCDASGWAMGPREVELAACGTFYLTEERGENREVLPMVPTFDGPEDFGDKVRWWLARPEARAQVAREAMAAVADRTFANHAALLLQHLT
jgi:spore maturation protein CgeB